MVVDGISDLSRRIMAVASQVWHTIDTQCQQVNSLFLRCHKETARFIKSTLSSLTARFVLYSLNELTGEEYQEHAEVELTKLIGEGTHAEIEQFQVSHDATLSVVKMVHPREKNAPKRTIVYLPANFEIWQGSIDYLKMLHQDLQADVYAINYRGTGGSTGFPEVDSCLINDVYAYVEKLIRSGVPAEQVVLFGGSIGGAVGTIVAGRFGDRNLAVNSVTIRSFRSLTALIEEFSTIAAQFAKTFEWQLNQEEALDHVKGRLICMYSDQDPVIPEHVGIKAAIDAKKTACTFIKMDEAEFLRECKQLAENPDLTPHIRPFTKGEQLKLATAIQAVWNRK